MIGARILGASQCRNLVCFLISISLCGAILRKYEPVWIEIKTTGVCRISAHKAFHRRIIKAVTKEKDMDLGYKLECTEAETPIRPVMLSHCEGAVITFTLDKRSLIRIGTI